MFAPKMLLLSFGRTYRSDIEQAPQGSCPLYYREIEKIESVPSEFLRTFAELSATR